MKPRHFFTALKVLLAIVCIGAVGASNSYASDGKVYPGSMCIRWSGDAPHINMSAIGNLSKTTWLYLDCPVIHDSIFYGIYIGSVRAINQHPSSNVTCSLNSVYRTGSAYAVSWSGEVSSAGNSTDTQLLSFGSVPSSTLSHYYYSCRIPPTSSSGISYIISYTVWENDELGQN
jgi:hypothetical protein